MEEGGYLELTDTKKEIIIDFGPICRFCLLETNSSILISDKFFNDKSDNMPLDSISNIVTKLCLIKIDESQNFPTLVCDSCHKLLKVCYNFVQICQWSDQSLKECYAKTLQEAKTKLNFKEIKFAETSYMYTKEKEGEIVNQSDVNTNTSVLSTTDSSLKKLKKKSNWNSVCDLQNAKYILKVDNLQKHDKINSFSDRLKKAQSKLSEDILKSNNGVLCQKKNYISNEIFTDSKSNIIKFQSNKCTKSFLDQTELTNHSEKFHDMSKSQPSIQDLNQKVKKVVVNIQKNLECSYCVSQKTFSSNHQLIEHLNLFHKKKNINPSNEHLINIHKLQEDNISKNDVKYPPAIESNLNSKLFKVFICTDCSPPVSFANVDSCIYHKLKAHEKQLESLNLKELSAVYVDSLDVFQQCKEVSVFHFKVLCKNCEPPLEFSSASVFVNHMYSCHGESTLENWEIKGKSVSDSTDESKDEATWKCSECPAVYFRRQSLYYHMKDKHKITINFKTMKCPDCEESFYTNRQVIQHGLSAHQKYFANFHKLFEKKILRTNKQEESDKIKNFECDTCRKKYVCKNSLKRHILKTHLGKHENNSVVCPYCGKTVSNKLNLKSHIEFVHEALFVSCPICKKKINFRTIGKHYNTHQVSSDFIDSVHQFLCNQCGKVLKSKKSFEDHQKLHKNIRDQLCDICGSGFTTKKFLHLHKKTHEGIKRKVFDCPQCDKIFSGKHTLKRHLLSHSGEKNFICEICSKCFYTLQELNRHLRYHKKEYRFDCQLCKMKFLDKSRFRHHMMRHRNIRPHKCQFCNKMFIDRRKMNLHMAAKHNFQARNTKAVWKDPKTYIPLDDLL